MAKAKKLSCNHLFHLACLRSWLDQGLNENYSCPTCRKPVFMSRPENRVTPHAPEFSTNELLARHMSAGLHRPNIPGHGMHSGVLPNLAQNAENGDSSWLNSDGAGPSGLGRVQMVMRQLAATQTSLEDASWSPFPTNASQAGTSRSARSPGSVMYPRGSGGLRVRPTSQSSNNNLVNILAMAETVQEVLPDDIIFQDLQRTNSVTVSVNNLLQMRY